MKKVLITLLAVGLGVFVFANGLAAGAATKKVTIVHVTKSCHVWNMGAERTANLTVSLQRGGILSVVNHDLDMHKLVQVAGPSMKTGPFMMMHAKVVLRFTEVGHYRFHTKVADMRGMPEARTIGPDNKLALTVHVS